MKKTSKPKKKFALRRFYDGKQLEDQEYFDNMAAARMRVKERAIQVYECYHMTGLVITHWSSDKVAWVNQHHNQVSLEIVEVPSGASS